MDDKILGYLIDNNRATDECLRGLASALNDLVKQAKINKRQKVNNIIAGCLIFMCMSNIGKLIIKVQKQDEKIEALIARTSSGDNVKKKGE